MIDEWSIQAHRTGRCGVAISGRLLIAPKNVTIVLGGDTRGQAEDCDLKWSYKLLAEEVAGTFAPTIGTGVFHGEFTIGELYTTDEDFLTMIKPAANGDIPITTSTFVGKDTGGPTTTTYTVTARFNDGQIQWKKGQFVVATVRSTEITSLTDGTTSFP